MNNKNGDDPMAFPKGCFLAIGLAMLLWMAIVLLLKMFADPPPDFKIVPAPSAESATEVHDELLLATAAPPRRVDFTLPDTDIATMYVEPGPEYANYTTAELESLAVVSAEAAVMLARRTQSTDEAERLYERAVVLSGKPGPLVEWMHLRDVGGIEHYNGVLNVDKALLGYEVALIQARFPYARQANKKSVYYYERLLADAGIPLDAAREHAAIRYVRMTRARHEIVGFPWENPT